MDPKGVNLQCTYFIQNVSHETKLVSHCLLSLITFSFVERVNVTMLGREINLRDLNLLGQR